MMVDKEEGGRPKRRVICRRLRNLCFSLASAFVMLGLTQTSTRMERWRTTSNRKDAAALEGEKGSQDLVWAGIKLQTHAGTGRRGRWCSLRIARLIRSDNHPWFRPYTEGLRHFHCIIHRTRACEREESKGEEHVSGRHWRYIK